VNVQEYISSGIVESYVLGLASPEERSEFESMCIQYPEVLRARTEFELAMEKQAMENAIAAPAGLKNKVWNQINDGGKLVTMQRVPVRSSSWLKYAAAACIVLLAGSLYWNISLYNKNKKLQGDYNSSVAKLNDMEKDIQVLQQNPNVKMASMKGMTASPKSFATVYWDTTTHDVYLLLNNLPTPASGMQYQLWAFLDKKPVDIGLIENDYFVKENRLLIKGKNIQNAQAFAITLEKKGRADISKPEGAVYVFGGL
jgi:anti-sigma-K factor RskA